MPDIAFDEASEKLGYKRPAFEKLVRNGKEIPFKKVKNKLCVEDADLDKWLALRKNRAVDLTKEEFLTALKFALQINYAAHTRADFGTARQRPFMQAIENWTQGALAEIALQKFIRAMFGIELQIEFRVFKDAIVGQDIVAVKKGRTINPPRIRVSVKSGKENGMVLIIPTNEAETPERQSDYYVFVRIVFPLDVFARFYRSSPEFSDMLEVIPEFESAKAYITGFCRRDALEKRKVPEAGIEEERYCQVSGQLRNSDADWKEFTDLI